MKRAFTLIEFLVVLAVLAILMAILAPVACRNPHYRAPHPEEEMRSYLKTLYPNYDIVGISCADKDSNYYGYTRYVPCSATITKMGSTESIEKQINAQCSTSRLGGCKPILTFPSTEGGN